MTVGVRSARETRGSATDALSGTLRTFIDDGLTGRIVTDGWTELLELKDAQEGRPVRPVRGGGTPGSSAEGGALLYVAATRARDELVVSWSGNQSRLLPAASAKVSEA